MTRDSLRSLYRETMDGLSSSPDSAVETLRSRWAEGQLDEPDVSPEQLTRLSDQAEGWATHAFHDFERNGFLDHNYRHFLWGDASRAATALHLDVLAGIETTVMLRSQVVDMAKVQSELDYRHVEILRAVQGGSALPIVLAMQRYFATLVVSIGSQELMRKYAGLNKASVCYAWAHQLQPSDVEDLSDWIVLIPEVIESRDANKAARLCQAMKCLPFGAQLPDLAVP